MEYKPRIDPAEKTSTSCSHNPINESDQSDYWYRLGLSRYHSGQLQEACRFFEQARQGIEKIPSLYRDYAICWRDQGNIYQAMEIIREGLAVFPDYTALYFLQGLSYYDAGLLKQSALAFQRYTDFNETSDYAGSVGANRHLAFANLAAINEHRHDLANAVQYTRLALGAIKADSLLNRYGRLLRQIPSGGEIFTRYLLDETDLETENIASILYAHAFYPECLKLLHNLPDSPETASLKWQCRQHLPKEWEEAEEILSADQQRLDSAALIKQICLFYWQQEPRRNAAPLLDKAGLPEDPMVQACRFINRLIFSEDRNDPNDNFREELLETAVAVLQLHDLDLALAIAEALGANNREAAYRLLGRTAFAHKLYPLTRHLLERVINPEKEDLLVWARACQAEGDHPQAFFRFWQIAQTQKDEGILAQALSEWAASLRMLLLEAEDHPPQSLQQIIRLGSVEKRSAYCANPAISPGEELFRWECS